MPDYNKIAAKNSDIDNIKNGVSVKTITINRTSQNSPNSVNEKFKEYSEQYKDNGDKTKSLSTQKAKSNSEGEIKYKNKDYFYSQDGDKKSLQVHKQSANQDRYRTIEGPKAERKFERVLKRNS